MKVALLSDCYLPRLGGIEVQVHDLAEALTRAGHDVEVFTATPGPDGERHGACVVEDGLPIHRMAIPLPGGIPVNPFAPPEVRRRLRAGGFDVAHVHMGVVSPFATDMARVALGLGLPTAITWHCVIDRSAPAFQVLGQARRWAERGAALSAVSSMAAERVRRVAGGRVEVGVLGNGIDAARWARPADLPPRDPAAPVRVVSAMRLARRKRPLAVLETLRAARLRLDPRVRLEAILLGEGPQRGGLERYLDRHGMSGWVDLPGRVTRDELRELHWDADLYLSTARLEAFGIAALEARTAGLPVVARRGTGVDDIVEDGVGGLLADDDDGLADAVARLAADAGAARPDRHAQPHGPARAGLAEDRRDDRRGVRPGHREGEDRVITVVGERDGDEVTRFALGHGVDPAGALHAAGWVGTPVAVTRPHPNDLLLRYAVAPATGAALPAPVAGSSARVSVDADLSPAEVAGAVRYQRVAAYAVVTSHRGVLLTELSDRTNAAGRWNLPGGGIDPDETPEEALQREVFEETGQRVRDIALLTVLTGHWVGRSPRGRVEDYHAVRIFHTARCPEPSPPVVHDVGGSTASAAWVRPEHLHRIPLAGSVAEALAAAGLPG